MTSELIMTPKNQIAWLRDKPILPEPKDGPKRNYKGVIIVEKLDFVSNKRGSRKTLSRLDKLPKNTYFMAGILAINLEKFGMVFINNGTSSIKFWEGSKVKVPRSLAEIHSNLGIRHKEWRTDKEIFDSVKTQKQDLIDILIPNNNSKVNEISTLKHHLWLLNSIYMENDLDFRIVSEIFWEGAKKSRKYRILNIDSPEAIARYKSLKTLRGLQRSVSGNLS